MTYLLKIGRETIPCATLKACRDTHSALRNESGLGASGWPRATITKGKVKYHVSYNSRIWDRDYAREDRVGPAIEIDVTVEDILGMSTRVQIPAYHDRWMMGDRFGEIVKTSHSPADALATPELRELAYKKVENYWDKIEFAHVRLDRSGKTVRVILADCTVL